MSRPGIRRLAHDQRGAAALEFAIVMLPLMMSIFFILNVGLQLFLQSNLDVATTAAARQVRLGLQTTDAGIRSAICAQLAGLVPSPCSGLSIYVTSGTSFSGLAAATVSGNSLSRTGVSAGTAGNAVLMQVAYHANSAAQFVPVNLTFLSSASFVNEP